MEREKRRAFKDLDLLDDYLNTAMASNEKYNKPCYRRILSVLLGREIGDIEIIAQRYIPGITSDYRGIRMDVEVKETDSGTLTNLYDIEPHKQKDLDFPRHNRFYAAKIDSRYVQSGLKDFSTIPNLFVITITNFDLFGMNAMAYTFAMNCKEYPEIPYDDGITMLYFNTTGENGGSQELRNMLSYIQESTSENAIDAATQEVHRYVEAVKQDPGLEDDYMTLGDILDREKEEGIRIGEARGKLETLVNMILKKMNKGLSTAEIAEQLEEPEDYIQHICQRLAYNNDNNLDSLIDELLKKLK